MKKIATSAMLATIALSGIIPINSMLHPISYAASSQEDTELQTSYISSALIELSDNFLLEYKLQMDARKTPDIQLKEVPDIANQQLLMKRKMSRWEDDLSEALIILNQQNYGVINKFNSYQSNLQGFVNNVKPNKQDKSNFLMRVEDLEETIRNHQEKLAAHISDMIHFNESITENVKDLSGAVNEGYEVLGAGDSSGKIAMLKKEIASIQDHIHNDLNTLASLPGQFNAAGWELFKEVYTLTKNTIDPVAESAIKVVQEGERVVQEAEATARKDAEASGKSKSEIEEAVRQARENAKKSEAMQAAAAAEAKKYDLLKNIDIERIGKIKNMVADVEQLNVHQRQALQDIEFQQQQLYNKTKDLKITEIQSLLMTTMEHDTSQFATQVQREITYLQKYYQDWEHIKQQMEDLKNPDKQLDRKFLMTELEKIQENFSKLQKQTIYFENTTNYMRF